MHRTKVNDGKPDWELTTLTWWDKSGDLRTPTLESYEKILYIQDGLADHG